MTVNHMTIEVYGIEYPDEVNSNDLPDLCMDTLVEITARDRDNNPTCWDCGAGVGWIFNDENGSVTWRSLALMFVDPLPIVPVLCEDCTPTIPLHAVEPSSPSLPGGEPT